MRVDKIIELLDKMYLKDEELMLDWVDNDQMECPRDVWLVAVGRMEGASAGMIDMDYVSDVVSEAKFDNKEKNND